MMTKSAIRSSEALVATAAQMERALRLKAQELWVGALYLMVWSVLWLAIVVGVLSPLGAFFAGQ